MTLTAIILIILLGLILLLLEILVLPGFGVAGILGALLMLVGIFFAYRINNTIGHLIFAGSFIASAGLIVLALRTKTWNRIMLKTEISGKVNTLESDIKAGDRGITVSRLAPMGKVKIGDRFAEASAQGEFINENTMVEIVKVDGNRIVVKKV
jgi:membrane-bound ClpP family serine protease